jgi:hypothetical protein
MPAETARKTHFFFLGTAAIFLTIFFFFGWELAGQETNGVRRRSSGLLLSQCA